MIKRYTQLQWIAMTYELNRGHDIYIDQRCIYCSLSIAVRFVGPRWFITLLNFRDRAVQSWGIHCLDLQLIREGQLTPLIPRWLQYGWH